MNLKCKLIFLESHTMNIPGEQQVDCLNLNYAIVKYLY